MKKKTINFYFFKNTQQRSTNLFSPITKNFIKHSKKRSKFIKLKKKTVLLKQKQKIIKTLTLYKRFVRRFVFTRWLQAQTGIEYLYLNSAFFKKKKSNKIKLFIFWKFKRIFCKAVFKQLSNYPKTGLISSHSVHFLLRKNLTYQSRSKYHAIMYNLPAITHYLYMHIKFVYNYIQNLKIQIFKFTTTFDQRVFLLNEDLNREYTEGITISSKSSNSLQVFNSQKINWGCFTVNFFKYTYDDFKFLYKNKDIIFEYINSSDSAKANSKYLFIKMNMIENKFNNLQYLNFFKNTSNQTISNFLMISFIFINEYERLYCRF